jgi:hypothetical protein
MYRRDFLKLGGLFSAAVFIPFDSLAKSAYVLVEVEAQGKFFRGTSDGKILFSVDAGKTWQLHTNFGPHVSIQDLWVNFWGQLQAKFVLAGHNFELVLVHTGNGWKTS